MDVMSTNSPNGIVMGNTEGSVTAAVIQNGQSGLIGGNQVVSLIGLETTNLHTGMMGNQHMGSKNGNSVQLATMVSQKFRMDSKYLNNDYFTTYNLTNVRFPVLVFSWWSKITHKCEKSFSIIHRVEL